MVDAVNITDNQTGVVRMASWATCLLAIQEGLEPNYQMVCRDRNRLAMQADILGRLCPWRAKHALSLRGPSTIRRSSEIERGLRHRLDSTDQHGPRKMRDDGKFLNGVEIDVPPKIFIGAAANPFAEPFEWRVHRLAKKIAAGADFVQTQCIYDMKRFREWMKQAKDMGLTEKISILAGVTPLKSGGMARYMAKNVSGIIIPDEIIDRIVKAPKPAEEGIKTLCGADRGDSGR